MALNVEEGWSRDVSEAIAHKVLQMAGQDDMELTDGTLAFIEAQGQEIFLSKHETG